MDASHSNSEDQQIEGLEVIQKCDQIQEENNVKDGKVSKPFIGMKFDTEDDAYNFYSAYASSIGFVVRKDYCYKSRQTKMPIGRMFVCSKEGHKDLKRKQTSGKDVKRRRDVREGCGAHLLVKVAYDGKWEVKKFREEHTHFLISPSKTLRLRSHMPSPSNEIMTTPRNCGIDHSKIATYLNMSGWTFITPQHCIHSITTSWKNSMGGEFMAVLSYFEKKLADDEGFFFRMVLDENDVVKSFFWADSRSQDNYMTFGDVVVFDTTHRTNKLKMPFTPFSGVNHHKQTTFFGCAYIADQTEDTLIWLFHTWLECMQGKEPICIVTDQDVAIANSIRKVFPGTRHIFCIWHIVKNALTYLRDLYALDNFKKEYFNWINDSLDIQDFEDKWSILKQKYNISNDHWLEHMYNKRHQWVPVYLNDTFCAGIQSIQRSESINIYLDDFLNPSTSLSDFVYQYDLALYICHEVEEHEDLKNLNNIIVPTSKGPLEIHAAKVYTQKVFNMFQEEFRNIIQFWSQLILEDSEKAMYSVYVSGTEDKGRIVVEYSAQPNILIKCSCKKYEQEGILCSHALLILHEKRAMSIPEHFILHRWTINARYSTAQVLNDEECISTNGVITPSQKLNFRRNLRKFSEMSLRSTEHLDVGISIVKEAIQRLEAIKKVSHGQTLGLV